MAPHDETRNRASATVAPATGKLARLEGFEKVFLCGTAPTAYAPINQDVKADDFLMNQFGASSDAEGEGKQEDTN